MKSKEVNFVISVVTYNRLWKWIGCMRNLRKVYKNNLHLKSKINLRFLFAEDTKTSWLIHKLKVFISALILPRYSFHFITGADNLGQSRDLAMKYCFESGICDFIGFIDDDDRYNEDIFYYIARYLDSSDISMINFCMSGNFSKQAVISCKLERPYGVKDRFRYWDDSSQTGCIPSMACFIRLNDWMCGGYKFGRNIPSEETSPLMAFMYKSSVVLNLGLELMYRHRAKNSLVSDLSKYDESVIRRNIIVHCRNLYRYTKNYQSYMYLFKIFKYNYGGYLKGHGADYVLVENTFKDIVERKLYK